ncbi:ODA4 [Symbiodinium natans]|uniref:ODA4 protein n=1 Tax=Symbiodinium natans TaxID=878477 RepID=A0A812VAN3_9DINO|nr:ODA4 [Symbiodinium natans]
MDVCRQILQVHGAGDGLVAAFSAHDGTAARQYKVEDALALSTLHLTKLMKDVFRHSSAGRLGITGLRDVSRLLQGVARAGPERFTEKLQLAKLWAHEALRTFEDRITADAGRRRFREVLSQQLETYFGVEPALEGLCFLFDPSSGGYVDTDCQETGPQKRVKEILHEFNEKNSEKGTCTSLHLFAGLMQHALRVARVLLMPSGHMLCIGPANSGRRTACIVGAQLAGAEATDIVKTMALRQVAEINEEFFAILRNAMTRAATLRERQLLILQLAKGPSAWEALFERFLDTFHTIVRHGDVQGAWTSEQQEAALKAFVNDADFLEEAEELGRWRAFVQHARKSLHTALLAHDTDWAVARPGYLTCVHVDCYAPPVEEALISIASMMTGIDRDVSHKDSNFSTLQVAEAVSSSKEQCSFVHANEPFCMNICAALDGLPGIYELAPKVTTGHLPALGDFMDLVSPPTLIASKEMRASPEAAIAKHRARRERLLRTSESLLQVVHVVDEFLGPVKEWLDKRRLLRDEVAKVSAQITEAQAEVSRKQLEVDQDTESVDVSQRRLRHAVKEVGEISMEIDDATVSYQLALEPRR